MKHIKLTNFTPTPCSLLACFCLIGSPINAGTVDCQAAGMYCGIELSDMRLTMTSDPLFYLPPGTEWTDGYEVTAELRNAGSSVFVAKYHGSTFDYVPGNVELLYGGGSALPSPISIRPGESIEFVISVISGLKNIGDQINYEYVAFAPDDLFLMTRTSMFFSLGEDQDPSQVPPTHYVTMEDSYQVVFDESLLSTVPVPLPAWLLLTGVLGIRMLRR